MLVLKKNIIIFIITCIFFQISQSASAEKFLSLKKDKVNVRYGPSFDFPVKYVYEKINLPIKQIDKKENWRRIIDFKNNSGWIHWSQLKKANSVIAKKDKMLFKKPSIFSEPIANIKKGRLLVIKKCEKDWCKVETENIRGWVDKKNLWGVMYK